MESEFYTPSQETIDRVAYLRSKQDESSVLSKLVDQFLKVERKINSEDFTLNHKYYFDMRKIPDEYKSSVTKFFKKPGLSWSKKVYPEGGVAGYFYGIWD